MPAPPTALIGREQECAALGHLLRQADTRLVTFTLESLECFQAFGDQHFGLPWAYHGLGETALLEQAITEALNR